MRVGNSGHPGSSNDHETCGVAYDCGRDRWIFSGEATGPLCEPAVPRPPGLARVEVTPAQGALLGPEDTAIHVLVTEHGCSSGREMGDALKGPR